MVEEGWLEKDIKHFYIFLYTNPKHATMIRHQNQDPEYVEAEGETFENMYLTVERHAFVSFQTWATNQLVHRA